MIAVRESYDWINVAKKLDFMYDAVKRFENNTSDIVREKYFKTFNVKKL